MAEPSSYTIRPASGAGALLSTAPVLLFCVLGFVLGGGEQGILWGAAAFLLFRLLFVRRVLLRDHARGVRLTARGEFEAALGCFVRSEAVWARRARLDRYRALLMGSSVRYPFLFLSIYNQAYVLGRLSRGPEAVAQLERLEAMSPGSALAGGLRDLLQAGASPRSPEPGPSTERAQVADHSPPHGSSTD